MRPIVMKQIIFNKDYFRIVWIHTRETWESYSDVV